MGEKGRPKEDIYLKYVSGKENSVESLCRNGADNLKLAEFLGCGKTTVGKLIRNYPEFKKLTKVNKSIADMNMEAALYRRGIGYEYEETATEVLVNKDGSGTTTYVKKTKKHVAGDTTAAIFWLKNRKPEEWRDKQHIEAEVSTPFLDMMKKIAERRKRQQEQQEQSNGI